MGPVVEPPCHFCSLAYLASSLAPLQLLEALDRGGTEERGRVTGEKGKGKGRKGTDGREERKGNKRDRAAPLV